MELINFKLINPEKSKSILNIDPEKLETDGSDLIKGKKERKGES